MGLALQVCSYLIGIPLELLAIAAILRGEVRRFPFVFAYAIADFLTTIVEMPSNLSQYLGNQWAIDALNHYYWLDEGIQHSLIYAVVISLIYGATAQLMPRRIVRAAVVSGAVLFAGVSFLIHYN